MLSSLGLGRESPYLQSGYNDAEAMGVSTPTGYGRKSKVAAVPITSMMVPVSGTGRKPKKSGVAAVPITSMMVPVSGTGRKKGRKRGGVVMPPQQPMPVYHGGHHDERFAFPAGHGAGRPVHALSHLHGGDWSSGLQKVGKQLASKGIDYGLSEAGKYLHGALGAGKKMKRHPAMSNRGEIVKQVMREHGMSLPQASSYVKQHGLYAPKMKKGGWNLLNGNSVTLI